MPSESANAAGDDSGNTIIDGLVLWGTGIAVRGKRCTSPANEGKSWYFDRVTTGVECEERNRGTIVISKI